MNELDDIFTPLSEWLKARRKVALATVISTWGSAPRPVGGQMAIDINGEIIGSVSGGCVEGAVIAEAIKSIKDRETRVKDYGISNNMAWEVGLACGGELKILIQPLEMEDDIILNIVELINNRKIIKIEINCSSGQRIIKNSLTENTVSYTHLTLPTTPYV